MKTVEWRKATAEEIAQGLDSPDNVGMIKVSEVVPTYTPEEYKEAVNELHNTMFRGLYESLNYLSIGEIPIWANDVDYGAESEALQAYWIATCKLVAEHCEGITEPTDLDPAEFIASLPKFEL
jgi:hypothetical protein